jgi:hypothetical protein
MTIIYLFEKFCLVGYYSVLEEILSSHQVLVISVLFRSDQLLQKKKESRNIDKQTDKSGRKRKTEKYKQVEERKGQPERERERDRQTDREKREILKYMSEQSQ